MNIRVPVSLEKEEFVSGMGLVGDLKGNVYSSKITLREMITL